MQYGFVIDQNSCIGCHACTVACKAENDVPLGSFRTSVKYVERGAFPDIKRMFLVQRCNHCTHAPCVTICPVNALSKRADGIVDVDRDACIGCRACMQACPYDAIYMNDDLHAVEKCHFCAHRVEKGLEPACVTVCPVRAIIPGDFHDPQSEVSLLKIAGDTRPRRPEQGTNPNVFYIGAEDATLVPGLASRPSSYIWSDRPPHKRDPWPRDVPTLPDTRVVLDQGHRVEWGWQVAAYLLTKGIAAGAAMLAPFFSALGIAAVPWWAPEAIALLFTILTVALLVEDLAKPAHFYKLFTRPNWNSWLVKGGVVLTVFAALSATILAAGFFAPSSPAIPYLRIANAAVGTLAAGYTAFLFAQCNGRDLWEGPIVLPHLLVQAVLAGGCALAFFGSSAELAQLILVAMLASGILAAIEMYGKHATLNAKQAAGFLRAPVIAGVSLPALGTSAMFVFGCPLLFFAPQFAFVPIFAGLFAYELAFVKAGQLPPLS
jgi:Fe-S-cluster-containing dehydrogenase component/formate-dependent nitrite reductase membrane component NrfD